MARACYPEDRMSEIRKKSNASLIKDAAIRFRNGVYFENKAEEDPEGYGGQAKYEFMVYEKHQKVAKERGIILEVAR